MFAPFVFFAIVSGFNEKLYADKAKRQNGENPNCLLKYPIRFYFASFIRAAWKTMPNTAASAT